jgi:hypothetical protein
MKASAQRCLWLATTGFPSAFLIIAYNCSLVKAFTVDLLDNFLNILKLFMTVESDFTKSL